MVSSDLGLSIRYRLQQSQARLRWPARGPTLWFTERDDCPKGDLCGAFQESLKPRLPIRVGAVPRGRPPQLLQDEEDG
jgi:hypothetical protein